jgi:HprK-related kinase A
VAYGTARFRALGLDFSVEVDDDALGRYLDRVYRPLAVPGTAEHHYRVTTRDRDGMPTTRLLFDGEEVVELEDGSLALAYLVWHVNRQVVALTETLLLHAAAAEHGGSAVVLPAPQESGKTTLVAGLVRAGARYVTDEAVALDLDTLVVQPYPKPMSIDPGSWSVLGDLAPDGAEAIRLFQSRQWHVAADDIRPGAVAEPCRAALVVFPTYSAGSATELRPIPRAEAVRQLALNSFNFTRFGRRGFEAVVRLTMTAGCYELSVGDLDDAVATVLSLLAETGPMAAETPPLASLERDGVVTAHLDDEAVLYELGSGAIHVLNASARAVWDRCDGTATLAEIADELSAAFAAEPARVRADVEAIVDELSDRGLLPTRPGS